MSGMPKFDINPYNPNNTGLELEKNPRSIPGCDVRVFDPRGLPMKDEVSDTHPKVLEIRELSVWSEGHVWVCPEQHGTITAVFKNQIDWIPLNLGSVRPTQGRTVCIAQVLDGSFSYGRNCFFARASVVHGTSKAAG
jgi:hypothetical protein